MTMEEKQRIAQELIEVPIEWNGDRGYFTCPMASLHTKKTSARDTVIYLDGAPTSYCFHHSCRRWHSDMSQALRSAMDDRSSEQKKIDRERSLLRRDTIHRAARLKMKLQEIYEQYAWNLKPIFDTPLQHYQAFFSLWEPGEYLWIGEIRDTGFANWSHFKSAEEWRGNLPSYHFTCSGSFQPGTIDRISARVASHKYLVIEFDQLSPQADENKRRSAALLKYICSRMEGNLRLVVDSGNKSLHGWFLNDFDEHKKLILRQLGADVATMRASQPVRLPGATRENNVVQSVLWIQR